MTLNSNALVTVDEFLTSLGTSKLDMKTAVIGVYNGSLDCTEASIAKSGNTLTLSVTGGVNAHTTTFDLTDEAYDTIGELAEAIDSLGKGWIVNIACPSSFLSADLYNLSSKSVKGEALEIILTGFNRLMLENYINIASQFAETYCNRKFVSQSFIEFYDGTGTQYLKLKNYPVSSISISDKFVYYDGTY